MIIKIEDEDGNVEETVQVVKNTKGLDNTIDIKRNTEHGRPQQLPENKEKKLVTNALASLPTIERSDKKRVEDSQIKEKFKELEKSVVTVRR